MMPSLRPTELTADQAKFLVDVRGLGIKSSADAPAAPQIGDVRGLEGLGLALNLDGPGYHAFVCGLEGPDRLERIAGLVRRLLRRDEAPGDWVYVHNFKDASRPRAIHLAAGDGHRLRREVETLLEDLRGDLPRAFHNEAFDAEKAGVVTRLREYHESAQKLLAESAERLGFKLAFSSTGLSIVPLVDGKPIESDEDIGALTREQLSDIRRRREAFDATMREQMLREREEQHLVDTAIHSIERDFARRLIEPRIRSLGADFKSESLDAHLEAMIDHICENLAPFRGDPPAPQFPFLQVDPAEALGVYAVNVVVEHSEADGARVVVVDSPTYKNLFGTIERTVDAMGRVQTDFRRIQAGAILEADGGVVVVAAEDALIEPFVWRVLRRALRSGRVEIEAYDPFVGFSPAALRPEPIPIDTKLVLVGERWVYEMLLNRDSEFGDLFKVLADFAPVVERSDDTVRALCGRIAEVEAAEALVPFESGAFDALVEVAVREAGDRRKIDLGSERVLDAAREASARARAAGHSKTGREEVLAAVAERVHRLDRIEESIRDSVARGQILVDVTGERVGQVNALAVSELGRHAFARPSRVTAAIGMGREGVVSIDRETELAGSIHDKGVMILESFLRDRFAHDRLLSLVASVTFEQSYAHIDGDSASLAELLAILSRIASIGLRQALAVTGSVNQRGEVQPVGAVTEKIEGFFDCCRVRGLSGDQGVVFPAANIDNVILRQDVVESIANGDFHLYPVVTVDEALEVLSGLRAGSRIEPDSFNGVVDKNLGTMSDQLRALSTP